MAAPSICELFGPLTQFPPMCEKLFRNLFFIFLFILFFYAFGQESWSVYSRATSTFCLLIYELDQAVFFHVHTTLAANKLGFPLTLAAATAVPSCPPLLFKKQISGNIFPRRYVPACPALCVNCRFFHPNTQPCSLEHIGEPLRGDLYFRFGDNIFPLL